MTGWIEPPNLMDNMQFENNAREQMNLIKEDIVFIVNLRGSRLSFERSWNTNKELKIEARYYWITRMRN